MAIIIIASTLGLVCLVRKWAWHTNFFSRALTHAHSLFSTPISKILGLLLIQLSEPFAYLNNDVS